MAAGLIDRLGHIGGNLFELLKFLWRRAVFLVVAGEHIYRSPPDANAAADPVLFQCRRFLGAARELARRPGTHVDADMHYSEQLRNATPTLPASISSEQESVAEGFVWDALVHTVSKQQREMVSSLEDDLELFLSTNGNTKRRRGLSVRISGKSTLRVLLQAAQEAKAAWQAEQAGNNETGISSPPPRSNLQIEPSFLSRSLGTPNPDAYVRCYVVCRGGQPGRRAAHGGSRVPRAGRCGAASRATGVR